jgi:CsoR family transcriptional regulator, copper-sensing transcriptional repressor
MAEAMAAVDAYSDQRQLVNRLKRLEGQIRGLQSMIESGQECEAILTQILAAKSALNQVGMHVIGHAMKECLIDEAVTDRNELIDEAIQVFMKYSACVK